MLLPRSHHDANVSDFQWYNHKRQILHEPNETSAEDASTKGLSTGDIISF